MIRNTVWLFPVILLFCTYSFGMYFLPLPSRTFLLVLAHYISSSVSLRIVTLTAHGLVILPNSVIFTFKYIFSGDFPARPVTKTPHSQCREPGFSPWSGNWISHITTKVSHATATTTIKWSHSAMKSGDAKCCN